jgi:hypothetical protein
MYEYNNGNLLCTLKTNILLWPATMEDRQEVVSREGGGVDSGTFDLAVQTPFIPCRIMYHIHV